MNAEPPKYFPQFPVPKPTGIPLAHPKAAKALFKMAKMLMSRMGKGKGRLKTQNRNQAPFRRKKKTKVL
jgi:hypothetical protein